MSSIGDALRQRRIQGRQSVAEAAGGSGLPKRVLIGFESGAVPLDDTQNLAHLRIYARYLGLDAEELLRSLRYRNGRPPVSHQRAGRRRVKQGKRPGDYGDTLTPGRQRLVNPAPASPISSPPAQPRGLTPPPSPPSSSPPSSPPPSSSSSARRRWAGLALLGAAIVAVAAAASVVLWDGLAGQSIVPAVPLAVVDRTALEAAHHRG